MTVTSLPLDFALSTSLPSNLGLSWRVNIKLSPNRLGWILSYLQNCHRLFAAVQIGNFNLFTRLPPLCTVEGRQSWWMLPDSLCNHPSNPPIPPFSQQYIPVTFLRFPNFFATKAVSKLVKNDSSVHQVTCIRFSQN